jgi:signal transduction histidine kinase
MSVLVGLSGWLLAALSIGAAALVRSQLGRHLEGVARACHELRGPITAARLGLELGLRIRQLPVSRLRAIELELERASLALEDLSVARARWRPMDVESVDLAKLAADSAEAWRAFASSRAASIRVDCRRLRWLVVGDRLRLAQALGNLIANAIEHGGGEVEIRLRGAPGKVRVEVVDSGPGLPAPLDQLCRRRRRLWTRRLAERGHGLAIVGMIAAAHGGRLAAAPSRSGARLVLELPAAGEVTDDAGAVVQL